MRMTTKRKEVLHLTSQRTTKERRLDGIDGGLPGVGVWLCRPQIMREYQ